MKICSQCGNVVEDQASFCTQCGSAVFSAASQNNEQTIQKLNEQVQRNPSFGAPTYSSSAPKAEIKPGNGNIFAGIAGAFLFSLIGGALYFLIYQAGVIAGISGLIIFLLANFGYGLFARRKNTIAGVVVSIVLIVIIIFAAEYLCLAYEVYKAYPGLTITLAVKSVPSFLADSAVRNAFIQDLAFSYIFGFVASIGTIINILKGRAKK